MPTTPFSQISDVNAVANALYWAQHKLPFPCVLVQASVENSGRAYAEKGRLLLIHGWVPFTGVQEHVELKTGYCMNGLNIDWTGELVLDEAFTLVAEVKHVEAGTYHRLQGIYRMLKQ